MGKTDPSSYIRYLGSIQPQKNVYEIEINQWYSIWHQDREFQPKKRMAGYVPSNTMIITYEKGKRSLSFSAYETHTEYIKKYSWRTHKVGSIKTS